MVVSQSPLSIACDNAAKPQAGCDKAGLNR